jgi:L-iditol 2-dehydrogenase
MSATDERPGGAGGVPARQRVVFLLGPERVEVREEPVAPPGPGEILLALGAATTCGTDVKVFRRGGHPRMLRVPTPFGHEMAGTVAAAGAGVEGWRPGDRVAVLNSAACGACSYCRRGRENLCVDLQYLNGAFAEYLLVPARFAARSTYRLPPGLPFELAALVEPLACVLHGVEACALDAGADVAVFGAGPIGLLFAGVLAAAGHRVVLADPNPGRLEVGMALGAEVAAPIARGGGQAQAVRRLAREGERAGFDAVVEATGIPEVWADAIACARPGGVVVLFGGCAPGTSVPVDTHAVHYGELTIKGVYHHRPATAVRALELLGRQAFDARLLLSGERPLEELEDALRAMARKEALKVVIRPGGGAPGPATPGA